MKKMKIKNVLKMSFVLSKEKKQNHAQRCKHFTFIYKKNKLLSIGINSPKTNPTNLRYNYINKDKNNISEIIGTHSEMNAIKKLKFQNYNELIIINTRINLNNEIDYSKPCAGCLQMIKELGFQKIYYTNKNSEFEIV